MCFYSTRQAAKLLKVQPYILQQAIWNGRMNAPEKGPAGAYLWTEKDLNHASWVLFHREFRGPENVGPSINGVRIVC
ncbi:MAG: hypothetical protein ACYTBP_04105 [Planctomycetota bacterium]